MREVLEKHHYHSFFVSDLYHHYISHGESDEDDDDDDLDNLSVVSSKIVVVTCYFFLAFNFFLGKIVLLHLLYHFLSGFLTSAILNRMSIFNEAHFSRFKRVSILAFVGIL